MAAYVIFIREGEIIDQAAMDAYLTPPTEPPSKPSPPIKPLTLYGAMETIEGDAADGIVILEFASTEEAREWYFGDYNDRAKLRQKAAPYRGFIVAGL